MKTIFRHLTLLFLLALPAAGDPAARAVELEARLKETAEASPAGAALMLELVDHYWQDGQVFGLIRTAGKFARTQTDHPRRAEVMLKLIDGYAATARHDDVIVTGRQFLERGHAWNIVLGKCESDRPDPIHLEAMEIPHRSMYRKSLV